MGSAGSCTQEYTHSYLGSADAQQLVKTQWVWCLFLKPGIQCLKRCHRAAETCTRLVVTPQELGETSALLQRLLEAWRDNPEPENTVNIYMFRPLNPSPCLTPAAPGLLTANPPVWHVLHHHHWMDRRCLSCCCGHYLIH